MSTFTSRSGQLAAGTAALLLLGWLGAGAWAGKRMESELNTLKSGAAPEGVSVRILKLSHETGLLSSRGKAEIGWVDECSEDLTADHDAQPLASLEYTISHLPLPTGLARFEWSATPAGDAAQELRALIGSEAKVTGNGQVSLTGQVTSDVSLPEISRRRTGLKVSPSKGTIEIGGKAFKFAWNLERFGLRSGGDAVDLRGVSLVIDLNDRRLGTGSYTVGIEQASLKEGSAQGVSMRAQALERGDRLDTTASYSARKLAWADQEVANLTFDLAVTGVDLKSAETLNSLFQSSCGFRNMTAQEAQSAKKAVAQMLTKGLTAGVSKLAAKSEDGSFDARVSLELAPISGPVPSLEKQLRAEGELALVIKDLGADQRKALLAFGFEPLREHGLRAQFAFRDGQLRLNGQAPSNRAEVAPLMAGLREADQALSIALAPAQVGRKSQKGLSEALTSALPSLSVEPSSAVGGASQSTAANPAMHRSAGTTPCSGDYDPLTWTDCVGSRVTPSGDRYAGGYLNGKAHGQGAYTFADGRKYVGQYDQGVRHGMGTEFRSDGSVAMQGRWEQGQYVSP